MAGNINNYRFWGDDDSFVAVAPKGTTGPTTIISTTNPLPTGFIEIGDITDAGVDESQTANEQKFRRWQGNAVRKTKVTEADRTYRFLAYEDNLVTHGLKYRGQAPTVTGTGESAVAKTVVSNQTATDDRAWIFHYVDGDIIEDHLIKSGSYAVTGTYKRSATEPSVLEITVTPLVDVEVFTNNPAITGSPGA